MRHNKAGNHVLCERFLLPRRGKRRDSSQYEKCDEFSRYRKRNQCGLRHGRECLLNKHIHSESVVFHLVLGRDIDLSLLGHRIACEVLVISADLVDQRAVRQELHDAVCRGFDDLVVS